MSTQYKSSPLWVLTLPVFFCSSFINSQFAFLSLAQAQSQSPAQSQAVVPSQAQATAKKTKTTLKQSLKLAKKVSNSEVAEVLGPKISKLEIRGNKKIETDAVLAKIKSKAGSNFSESQVREDIIALFKTGYFFDIKVEKEVKASEAQLVYTLVEKPSVTEIVFEGNSELKSEELQEGINIKAFEILNMTKVRDSVDKIQKLYEDKGFFLAKIDSEIIDVVKDETVKLKFKVKENDKVRVQKITFLGNQKLKDGFLKGRLQTQEGGFFSFMSGSGAYKQDIFETDTQRLRFIYFNEGYIQVKIERPQVYVTPDKKSIYITIRIDEGEQFEVGEIDFAGDILYTRQELNDLININKQKIFSYEALQKDLSELQAKYGDQGYAFANIIPRTRINEKDRKVDVTFEFDKGSKVYFGQINVIGNSKTRDKVVRRELKIREGELYNETRRRESLEGVQRLGFFDEVVFKTSTPADKTDVLNIDISVKERNTGSIQLGAGYGSATGFTLQGQVNQANFLGKGQKLGASLSLSRDASIYNLNFTEPYFNDSDWSLGFDVYQSQSNRYDYLENKRGGALRLGHPIGDFLSASLRYKYDVTQLNTITATKVDGTSYVYTDQTLFPLGTANGDTSSVTGILEFDQRNDRFSPTKGMYASTSLEYAGLGGTIKYTKGNATFRYFKKVFWEVVWRNNLSYSFINSNDGSQPPFNELYLLGGPYSLRGYRFMRVGKSVFSQTTYDRLGDAAYTTSPITDVADKTRKSTKPFGGTKQALLQLEFEFPLIAEAGIKGVTFYDLGAAEDTIESGSFYSNVGFGFRWFSPIGPLRFEWGFPLKENYNSPDPVNFEFSIGSPF